MATHFKGERVKKGKGENMAAHFKGERVKKGKGEKMATPLKSERVKRWLRPFDSPPSKPSEPRTTRNPGEPRIPRTTRETLVKPRTPNPHPLLLAIQRLYHCLSHGFQCIAVDVLQVIV